VEVHENHHEHEYLHEQQLQQKMIHDGHIKQVEISERVNGDVILIMKKLIIKMNVRRKNMHVVTRINVIIIEQ
jgi:hypothetical protein